MLRAGPVVLFFYPRAMTSGCTAEACHFRDLRTEFEKVGAQRIGISVDPVNKQKQFSDKHDVNYPLLSDGDGSVARARVASAAWPRSAAICSRLSAGSRVRVSAMASRRVTV